MAKNLVWYEVIDLTSWGIKYPADWYERNGRRRYMEDAPVLETLGNYSSKTKAVKRLKEWSLQKGIDYESNKTKFPEKCLYFENDFNVTCEQILEVGIWFNINDEPAKNVYDRYYGTGAAIVKKTMELDKD